MQRLIMRAVLGMVLLTSLPVALVWGADLKVIQTQKAKDLTITLMSESGQWTQGKNTFVLECTSAATKQPVDVGKVTAEHQHADARYGPDARRRYPVSGQGARALSWHDQLSGPWGAASHGSLGWAGGQGFDPVLGPCPLGDADRRHQERPGAPNREGRSVPTVQNDPAGWTPRGAPGRGGDGRGHEHAVGTLER